MHINEYSCSGLQLRTHTICNYTVMCTTKNISNLNVFKYRLLQIHFLTSILSTILFFEIVIISNKVQNEPVNYTGH